MFIDYLTLLLTNLTAGLFLLAYYVLVGIDDNERDAKRWVAPFAMVGLVQFLWGLHLSLTWPLPGSFNIVFGEASVLFGILFLGAALALWNGWDLKIVAIYGVFAGLAAIVMGARLMSLGMTREPVVSGIGFILAGLGGIAAWPTLFMKENRPWRVLAAVVLVIAGLLWAQHAYMSYWGHMKGWAKWTPTTIEYQKMMQSQ